QAAATEDVILQVSGPPPGNEAQQQHHRHVDQKSADYGRIVRMHCSIPRRTMAGWYRNFLTGFTIEGWPDFLYWYGVHYPLRAMPRPDTHPDPNPQARQMADESMVRNLAAQALAIWPQESRLFRRYPLPAAARIADIGCGTGEITSRLAEQFPQATLLGVDIYPSHIEHASRRYREIGARLQFLAGDAFALDLPANDFDLTVCRHLLQAVPFPERVIAELTRNTNPGGWLHLLAEDYGLIHLHP